MLPFKHFSHVSVTVTNLDTAKAFYGGVLGLPEIPRPDFGFPGAWYSLGGDLQLHIIVNEKLTRPPVERESFEIRYPHFALWTEDADETARKMAESGAHFYDPHHAPERGGLPGPVPPDERDHLPRLHAERHALQDMRLAVIRMDVVEGEERHLIAPR